MALDVLRLNSRDASEWEAQLSHDTDQRDSSEASQDDKNEPNHEHGALSHHSNHNHGSLPDAENHGGASRRQSYSHGGGDLLDLPVETVPVVFRVRLGNMPEFTTCVMRSSIDMAERAQKKEWEEADEDERAEILMGDAISEVFW